MLLKMLNDTDFVVQECNQIIAHIGSHTVTAPLTDNTIRIYGEYKVTKQPCNPVIWFTTPKSQIN